MTATGVVTTARLLTDYFLTSTVLGIGQVTRYDVVCSSCPQCPKSYGDKKGILTLPQLHQIGLPICEGRCDRGLGGAFDSFPRTGFPPRLQHSSLRSHFRGPVVRSKWRVRVHYSSRRNRRSSAQGVTILIVEKFTSNNFRGPVVRSKWRVRVH
jgi:hypothetical protein